MGHSLKKLFVMIISTFMDLHSLLWGGCEGNSDAEKGQYFLPLYFCKPLTIDFTYKIRQILRYLSDCELSWIGKTGLVLYSMAKHLITLWLVSKIMTLVTHTLRDINNENSWKICSKVTREMTQSSRQDQEWIAYYEDIELLNNLDVNNTMRCEKHVKNCALQNIKI